jgi:hypothetical protein
MISTGAKVLKSQRNWIGKSVGAINYILYPSQPLPKEGDSQFRWRYDFQKRKKTHCHGMKEEPKFAEAMKWILFEKKS